MPTWKLTGTADKYGEREHCWITRDGHAVDLEDVVAELQQQQAEIERLRNVDAELAREKKEVERLEYAWRDLQRTKDREVGEAREAARWLLPFLVNEPKHLAIAIDRYPWLEEGE